MKNLAYLSDEFLEEEGSADSNSNRVILWENGKKVEAVNCSERLGYDIYKETTTGKYRVAIPESVPVELFPSKFSNLDDTHDFIQDETEREFYSLDVDVPDEDNFRGDEEDLRESHFVDPLSAEEYYTNLQRIFSEEF